MAGDHTFVPRRQFAFHHVEIGPADAAGEDMEKNLTALGLRPRNIGDLERTFRDRPGSG
jgi:hypothetical protein